MPTVGDFLDTNVLVYAFDSSEPGKRERAHALMAAHPDAVISTQVLLEWFAVVTRKFSPPMPKEEAAAVIAELAALTVVPADAELVVRAAESAAANQLSIWDAMVVESAALGGCQTLWSEDLADGAILRGVTIRNPFGNEQRIEATPGN